MEFVLVTDLAAVSTSVRVLSEAQIIYAASREARERAIAAGEPGTLSHCHLISGAALRHLCLQQLRPAEQEAWGVSDEERLHCIIAHRFNSYAHLQSSTSYRVLPAADVAAHCFHVDDLIAASVDQLVVFTVWNNLEPFAHSHSAEEGTPSAAVSPPARLEDRDSLAENTPQLTTTGPPSRSSGQRPLDSPNLSNAPSGLPSAGLLPPSTKRLHREAVYESVSSTVRHNDIEAVNELIDHNGLPSHITRTIVPYACQQCSHLPQFTLTMSCCGAILCARCVPSPPTITDIFREERLCPVCKEEPLEPPQSHPARDVQVHRLVTELKVLYYPQLKALMRGGASVRRTVSLSDDAVPPLRPNPSLAGWRLGAPV